MKVQKIIPYILAVVFLCSCGSKKKLVEKEKVRIETSTSISQTDINETKKDSTGTKTETKVSITDESTIELTQADPNKEITLIDSQGRETKIKGANAVISKRKEVAKVEMKDSVSLISNEVAQTDLKIETNTKKESQTVKKDLAVKRGFPWWIIIIVGVVYLVVSYFRKTLNPLGWV
jgi:hypothetical protein